MPENAAVTLTPTSFSPGYCYPSDPQRFLLDICRHIQAFLPGNYSTFVYGSTVPIAADREKPWIDTSSGYPLLRIYANGAWVTYQAFKTGDIIMFSGDTDNIVAPWYLCNGENGTPDLRDKFILGWSSGRPVGTTGGEESHTLTQAELPAVTIPLGVGSLSNGTAGAVTYVLPNASNDPTASGGHSGAIGSGVAHNNMPPWYALAFQMYKAS